MSLLTKCAKCGKKPTVPAGVGRSTWKDVAKPTTEYEGGGMSFVPSSVLTRDTTFATSLRADGANEDNRIAAQRFTRSGPNRADSSPSRQQRATRTHSPSRVDSPSRGSVFSRLTDSSGYTGAHRHRFGANGRGLGRDGRDRISKGSGYVPLSSTIRRDEAFHPPPRDPPLIYSDICYDANAFGADGTFCHHFEQPRQLVHLADSPDVGFPVREADDASIEEIFARYCGAKPNMDGRTFAKVCRDCGLIDRGFLASDADLIFSKVVTKGQRRIRLDEFLYALDLVAERKAVDADDLESAVVASGGPALYGTVADEVRFHDDKSTYTGVYARGGPEPVNKGIGSSSTLASAGMRRAQ